MKRKFILLILYNLLTATVAYTQNRYDPRYLAILDSAKGRQLLKQCSRGVPENVSGFWVITTKERDLLGGKFRRLFKKISNQLGVNVKLDTFQDYCFQCVGVVINHRRYIYISAFAMSEEDLKYDDFKNWQTEPIVMCDGGNAVWGVLWDLKSKRFSQLEFNGVA